MTRAQDKDIAVVGVSAFFPGSMDGPGFWRDILLGKDLIRPVPETHWSLKDYYDPQPGAKDKTWGQMGGFLRELPFDPVEWGIPPNSLEATDSSQILALLLAKKLTDDFAVSQRKSFNRSRTSVILGVTAAQQLFSTMASRLQRPAWESALKEMGLPQELVEDACDRIASKFPVWQENTFPGLLGNVVAGRIANRLNLGGSNFVTDAACASALAAVSMAVTELQSGHSDLVLTGGVDTMNDIMMYMCFSKTPALSKTGQCRPFDKDADGTILGEGVGMFALKRLTDAEEQGDHIYAVVKGIGKSSDGNVRSVYAPWEGGQNIALHRAYEQAGFSPDTVGLIEAHGTGTKAGDATEIRSLNQVFRRDQKEKYCVLGSVKSQIGHTKAAAGAAGLFKAVMALHQKVLPPTIRIESPADLLCEPGTPFYLNHKSRPWLQESASPRRAGVSSFGFGGSNFHVALEEYQGPESKKPVLKRNWPFELFLWGADSKEALKSELNSFLLDLTTYQETSFHWFARECQKAFYWKSTVRLSVVSESLEDLRRTLETVVETLAEDGEPSVSSESVYYQAGSPDHSQKVCFLYPGQGSQRCYMGQDLAVWIPEYFKIWEQLSQDQGEAGIALRSKLMPASVYKASEKKAQENELRETQWAQPGLGLVSLSMNMLFKGLGVTPEWLAGHSFGELSALHGAGALSAEDCLSLAFKRGKIMQRASEKSSGSMIAVLQDAGRVKDLLADSRIEDLVIANYNAPSQTVLSGPTDRINDFHRWAGNNKVQTIVLPVSAAFHSPLVSECESEFFEALHQIKFESPKSKVFSTRFASPYPRDPVEIPGLLASQLSHPVRFQEQVEAIYDQGCRLFVEVGAGTVLSGLSKKILKEKSVTILHSDSGDQHGLKSWLKCLGALASRGVDLNLDYLWQGFEDPAATKNPGAFQIPVNGGNHHIPPECSGTLYQSKARKVYAKEEFELQTRCNEKIVKNPEISTELPFDIYAIENNQQQNFDSDRLVATQQQEPDQPMKETRKHTQESEKKPSVLDKLLDAFGESQKHAAFAHEAYQKAMSESHKAFLSSSENSLKNLTSAFSSAPFLNDAPQQKQSVNSENQRSDDVAEASFKVPFRNEIPLNGTGPDRLQTESRLASNRQGAQARSETFLPVAGAVEPGQGQSVTDQLEHAVEVMNSKGLLSEDLVEDELQSDPMSTVDTGQESNEAIILRTVSEKTGYPESMLNFEMDLERDLGVDSIKKVEILSLLGERIPVLKGLQSKDISDFNRLDELLTLIENQGKQIPATSMGSTPVSSVAKNESHILPDSEAVQQNEARTQRVGASEQEGLSNNLSESRKSEGAFLNVVSAKTGYPADMLNLDMNMEGDLGIDSIKQVEILSALNDLEGEDGAHQPDDFGGIQTLRDVLNWWIGESTPDPVNRMDSEQGIVSSVPNGTMNSASTEDYAQRISLDEKKKDTIQSDPGTPHEVHQPRELRLPEPALTKSETDAIGDISLERHMRYSVELTQQPAPGMIPVSLWSRQGEQPVYLTDCGTGFSQALVELFRQKGIQTELVSRVPEKSLKVIYTYALRSLQGSTEGVLEINREAFQAVQTFAQGADAPDSLFISIQDTGGDFALESTKEGSTQFLGLSSLLKTLKAEHPDRLVRSIDLDRSDLTHKEQAQKVFKEIMTGGSELEVGLCANGKRLVPKVVPEIIPDHANAEDFPLQEQDVVVVSGGARGVTAAVVRAMASQKSLRFLLLGRTELVEEPECYGGYESEQELRTICAEQAGKEGIRLAPVEIGREVRRVLSCREITRQLNALRKLGSEAVYLQVDILNEMDVVNAVDSVRSEWGGISGLIHGAGVLQDRLIKDKTVEQFNLVFQTKYLGLMNLLKSVKDESLKLLSGFSSVAACFGNRGQCDYAMANEVLNQVIRAEAVKRPASCKISSLMWGPWDGGMVGESLADLFRSKGISLLPVEEGCKLYLQDITNHSTHNRTPVLGEKPLSFDSSKTSAMISDSTESSEIFVDQNTHPYLKSHAINGRIVVPMVMVNEWFHRVTEQYFPGFPNREVRDLRVFKGLIVEDFYGKGNRYKIEAVCQSSEEQFVSLMCTVKNESGQLCYTAKVHLKRHFDEIPTDSILTGLKVSEENMIEPEYGGALFHGPDFQVIRSLEQMDHAGGSALLNGVKGMDWTSENWLTDPAAFDGGLQLAVLWSEKVLGGSSLPTEISRVRSWSREPVSGPVRCILKGRGVKDHSAISDMYFVDQDDHLLAALEGVETHLRPDSIISRK